MPTMPTGTAMAIDVSNAFDDLEPVAAAIAADGVIDALIDSEADALGVGDGDGDGDGDELLVGVIDADTEIVGVLDDVSDTVGVTEGVMDSDAVFELVNEMVGLLVDESDTVGEPVGVTEMLLEADDESETVGEALKDNDFEGVFVNDFVFEPVRVTVCVMLEVSDGVSPIESDTVGDAVTEGVTDDALEIDTEAVIDGTGVIEIDDDGDGVNEIVAEAEAESETVGDTLDDKDLDGDFVNDFDFVDVFDVVCVTVAVSDKVGVGVACRTRAWRESNRKTDSVGSSPAEASNCDCSIILISKELT